ncbi:hypothetical protein E1B28_012365 [Marasmius oreades]|uniref:CBM1 domain-containing protein n=1 Tax=Marasmius oreades TaxID=181124 RepID=A0A9P7RRB1_9AGAR|nr:uncharacterized protein E1B28_012365 [Marasmius oreades]KAG7088361.1 hypothetical protein E1B28_012365 [Marasmius oreades]
MIPLVIGTFALLAGVASAGTKLWDGSFNPFTTAADFDKWSWANQVGTYQWYIHGSQPTSHYLDLSSSYKNPAMTSEQRGLKATIDSGATWNGQTMARTELIPQTSSNLGTGNLFYHFSVKRTSTNAPDPTLEHQVCFFESHFTELKYGVAPNPTNLQWMVGGVSKWSTPFNADTWLNFAYDIDFSKGTVGLWASSGSSPLVKVVQNVAASTSTNSADWHLGVLRIVAAAGVEDWYFSGVYVESGPITTAIGSGSSTGGSTTDAPTTTQEPPSTTTIATTTTASGPVQTHFGQCGGNGWTGPTACESPYTCKDVSPPYYSQCL